MGEGATEAGRPSIIDVALDAARRQVALERRAISGRRAGDEAQELDQRHAHEAMRRLREEHALDGNDAEAVFDFALRHVRLEEEAAPAREESTGLRRDKGNAPPAKQG